MCGRWGHSDPNGRAVGNQLVEPRAETVPLLLQSALGRSFGSAKKFASNVDLGPDKANAGETTSHGDHDDCGRRDGAVMMPTLRRGGSRHRRAMRPAQVRRISDAERFTSTSATKDVARQSKVQRFDEPSRVMNG